MTNRRQSSRRSTWFCIVFMVVLAVFALAACGGGEEEGAEAGANGGEAAAVVSGPLKFIYFYSADCAGCPQMDPIIDGLAADYQDQIVVEKYDAASEEGQKLMSDYGLTRNPSYVILGADGTKLWSNTGQIHNDMLRQQLTTLLSR